ncbi:hypothetical protein BO83DRAFT_436501 [Aspergillus eucalypticola CBS 122712]|uniref:DEAD-box RNA helicase Q domain-containing protein n=1 Tax=Aspergillus eucalypticola (strain CBS 122712 / IBT 29274) TaxID=1448314 RepID=A0A317VS29_ASPEC|nr:uncharacterized protein BO83DRAFT_436501 [Aspergillus eucalypticola CBS 122712]PWY75702.1 hypothetical protein BO83DRAFT_436501 [Aspergillus eucalypticola CBS 122712]
MGSKEAENWTNFSRPVETFGEAGFPQYVLSQVKDQGLHRPTVIQPQGWPMALYGHDFVDIAETDSGKTLTNCLSAIVHINAQPSIALGDGPIGNSTRDCNLDDISTFYPSIHRTTLHRRTADNVAHSSRCP